MERVRTEACVCEVFDLHSKYLLDDAELQKVSNSLIIHVLYSSFKLIF